MKTNHFIIYLCTAAFLITACDKSSTPRRICPDDGQITFSLTGEGFSANVKTKAEGERMTVTGGINSLSDLTAGEVYWNCYNSTTESMMYSNVQIQDKINSETGLVSTGKYWPSSIHNYTYCISNATMDSTSSDYDCLEVASNSDDIVCGKGIATWKQAANITLEHIFARTGTAQINAQEGYSISDVSVKLIAPAESNDYGTGGTFQIGNGWTAKNHSWTEALYGDQYVCPGHWAVQASYTLTKDDYSEHFTKTSANIELVAGKVNNITATATGGAAEEISFSVILSPWEEHNIAFAL